MTRENSTATTSPPTTNQDSANGDRGGHPLDRERTTATTGSRTPGWGWLEATIGQLVAALVFGVAFGFLLQKGGVAKFDILIGVLLLENFVVVKVMLSAIIVGMIGVLILGRMGLIRPQINDTRYGAQTIGGLIFGVGFALLAYCPGTNAAALGQGNWDALVGVAGLLSGSYLFALLSRYGSGRLHQLGSRGKLTLPQLVGVSRESFIALAAPLLALGLLLLEIYGP